MGKIRVLVVGRFSDKLNQLIRIVEDDLHMEVVATAQGGIEGTRFVTKLRPDVVLLHVDLLDMRGIEALAIIMDELPTRILLCCCAQNNEQAEDTIEALLSGAVDFLVMTPNLSDSELMELKEEVIRKINLAVQTPLSKLIAAHRSARRRQDHINIPPLPTRSQHRFTQVIAIGSSVESTRDLEMVLKEIPEDFPYPIIVVQHMPPLYTSALARSLNNSCGIRVIEAEDGQLIQKGTAYIAPGGYHMVLSQHQGELYVVLHQETIEGDPRPGIEVTFGSISELTGLMKHYVIMSGTSTDGIRGMALAKQQGVASTMAGIPETRMEFGVYQDQNTFNHDSVDYIVPVTVIAAMIRRLTGIQENELLHKLS